MRGYLRLIVEGDLLFILPSPFMLGLLEGVLVGVGWGLDIEILVKGIPEVYLLFLIDRLVKQVLLLLSRGMTLVLGIQLQPLGLVWCEQAPVELVILIFNFIGLPLST